MRWKKEIFHLTESFLWIQNRKKYRGKKDLQEGGKDKCQSLTETVCFCQKKQNNADRKTTKECKAVTADRQSI